MPPKEGPFISEDGNTWKAANPNSPVFYTSQGAQNAIKLAQVELDALEAQPDTDPEKIRIQRIHIERLKIQEQLAQLHGITGIQKALS